MKLPIDKNALQLKKYKSFLDWSDSCLVEKLRQVENEIVVFRIIFSSSPASDVGLISVVAVVVVVVVVVETELDREKPSEDWSW